MSERLPEDGEALAALTPEQRELYELLLAKDAAGEAKRLVSVSARPGDRIPLSGGQERFWFLTQIDPVSPAYNVTKAIDLRGPLDVSVLERALGELVRRHQVFRVCCEPTEGRPVGILHAFEPLSLVPEEVAGRAAADRQLVEEARVRLPLDRAPLLRARLLRLGDEDHVLILVTHHFVVDGLSVSVMVRELMNLYRAFAAGRPSPLPELPLQFADFARWSRQRVDPETLRSQIDFWRETLEGAPSGIDLPVRSQRPALRSDRGGRYWFELPPRLAERVKAFSRQQGVTVFTTLLATFSILLQRLARQDDLVIGTAVSGRPRQDVESLIGPFGNNLSLRLDLAGAPSFRALIGRTRDVVAKALAHQDIPFERIIEELQPERSPGLNPFFQVVFMLHQETRFKRGEVGRLDVSLQRQPSETSRFDLILETTGWEERHPLAYLEYSEDLFDLADIEAISRRWLALVEAALDAPDRRVVDLPILLPGEAETLDAWSLSQRDYPRDLSLHELFEAQVDRDPEATALVAGSESLSYGALDGWANRLASALVERGLEEEAVVAVAAERRVHTVVAMLAVLKAGGAYLPLDPDGPSERNALLLADSGASLLVCGDDRTPWEGFGGEILEAETHRRGDGAGAGQRLRGRAHGRSLAYVLYTSGTTGRPNGVEVEHRSVSRLVHGLAGVQLGPGETLLHMAPLSFDASTFEIWGALLTGARCVLHPEAAPTAASLGAAIERHGVTTLWLTASLFNLIVDEDRDALRGIRQLLVGGEPLSAPHVRRALAGLPDLRLWNGYGPTEATTFACTHEVSRDLPAGATSVPIGRPLAHTEVRVLDGQLRPVPVGVAGELCIGGDALARGYLGRSELTAERFVPHPFSSEAGARLYRSGDLARYAPDGTLEYLGRLDEQVKIRGFRIEPAEIAAVLAGHPAVEEAAVIARREGNGTELRTGRRELVAGLVPRAGTRLDEAELRVYLAERLPDYMIPTRLASVADLPRTPNGKLDAEALSARIPPARPEPESGRVAPRDAVEEKLCRIWRKRLGVSSIGVHDDFFALGGHSLLAIEILARVKSSFGVDLPVITLFERPTVAALAVEVRERRSERDASCLVGLQPHGDGPPLFCVPGGASDAMTLSDLARRLGPAQPFYGLNYPGVDGVTPPLDRIEALAATFLEEIRGVQSEGPYFLAGSSGGGVVAYEMARQLRDLGERVALLALLDTHAPWYPRMREQLSPRAWSARLLYAALLPRGTNRLGLKQVRRARRHKRLRRRASRLGAALRARGIPVPHKERYFEVLQAMVEACDRYEGPAYAGRTVLFRTKISGLPSFYEPDPTLGWGDCAAGGLQIRDIPGAHSEHIREPHVGGLARELAAAIAEARQHASV